MSIFLSKLKFEEEKNTLNFFTVYLQHLHPLILLLTASEFSEASTFEKKRGAWPTANNDLKKTISSQAKSKKDNTDLNLAGKLQASLKMSSLGLLLITISRYSVNTEH